MTIAEMVAQYRVGQTDFDSAFGGVCVLALFDHDTVGWHLLVQVWDTSMPCEQRRWRYELFLVEGCDLPVRVCEFHDHEHGNVPWVEAAAEVAAYRAARRAAWQDEYAALLADTSDQPT